MKIYQIGLVAMSMFIFSGCSSKYPVTFYSNPQGASLVCDGKNLGYTPKTFYIDRDKLKGMSSIPVNCSANWVSGAITEYPTSIPLDRLPNGASAVAQRPSGDGYETDVQFALQVQQTEYLRRQTEATEQANLQNTLKNINKNLNDQNRNFQLQQMNNYLRYGY